MARARKARTSTPGQLTLDDWVAVQETIVPAPDTPNPEAERGGPVNLADAAMTGAKLPSARVEACRPGPTKLLETPEALLTRKHLHELGLERRAIDAVFRALAVVALPGYSRPMIRVRDYLELLDNCTFRDDRVRPIPHSRALIEISG